MDKKELSSQGIYTIVIFIFLLETVNKLEMCQQDMDAPTKKKQLNKLTFENTCKKNLRLQTINKGKLLCSPNWCGA